MERRSASSRALRDASLLKPQNLVDSRGRRSGESICVLYAPFSFPYLQAALWSPPRRFQPWLRTTDITTTARRPRRRIMASKITVASRMTMGRQPRKGMARRLRREMTCQTGLPMRAVQAERSRKTSPMANTTEKLPPHPLPLKISPTARILAGTRSSRSIPRRHRSPSMPMISPRCQETVTSGRRDTGVGTMAGIGFRAPGCIRLTSAPYGRRAIGAGEAVIMAGTRAIGV